MGGRWLNADEVKEAQGMVKYKGRWVTPEEKERREHAGRDRRRGHSWVKQIKLLRDAYLAGPAERSQEAERRLLAIEEPVAIGPVLKVLGDDPIPGAPGPRRPGPGGDPRPRGTHGPGRPACSARRTRTSGRRP